MQGYDTALVENIRKKCNMPLTVLGGAGTLDDIKKMISINGSSSPQAPPTPVVPVPMQPLNPIVIPVDKPPKNLSSPIFVAAAITTGVNQIKSKNIKNKK